MRKDPPEDCGVAMPKSELEEMVHAIGSPGLAVEEPEEKETDPTREPPRRTLMRFVTKVLRHSHTSINVLQALNVSLLSSSTAACVLTDSLLRFS